MAVKLDGTQNALILDATSVALTLKSGVNTTPWTMTFPTNPGTAGQVLSTDGNGVLSWVTSGGGGTPGGANTQVQYNNNGAFSGSAGFTFNGSNAVTLGVGGASNGTLRLLNSGNSNAVSVTAQVGSTAWTMALPTDAGLANQVLQTDGAGATSWVTPSGGASIPLINELATATVRYPLTTSLANIGAGFLTDVYTADPDYTFESATGQLVVPHTNSSTGIALNANTVTANYNVPSGSNGLSAGTITVNPGVTVTADAGSSWVIA